MHQLAIDAVESLNRIGAKLWITPQNLVEFRSVATRPSSTNGLGRSSAAANAEAAKFQVLFSLLEETPAIFPIWKALVEAEEVLGKQVQGARLVAVGLAHQVTGLLTFNGGHFNRLARFGPGLTIVDPAGV